MKIYCLDCKYRLKAIPYQGEHSNLCGKSAYIVDTPISRKSVLMLCTERNKDNNCSDFEKFPWWRNFL